MESVISINSVLAQNSMFLMLAYSQNKRRLFMMSFWYDPSYGLHCFAAQGAIRMIIRKIVYTSIDMIESPSTRSSCNVVVKGIPLFITRWDEICGRFDHLILEDLDDQKRNPIWRIFVKMLCTKTNSLNFAKKNFL